MQAKESADDAPERAEAAAESGSLLGIAFAPAIWAGHFLALYIGAGIVCAKWPQLGAALAPFVAGATLAALVGILAVAYPSWRRWRREQDTETDHGSAAGRAHFLAHASLLLAGLSVFAVLLQALPAVLAGSCQ